MKFTSFLLIASIGTAQALDLTPMEAKSSGEGGQYSFVEFRDGRKKVSYMPPSSWVFRGDASCFRLADRDTPSAEIDITLRPVRDSLKVDEAKLKEFEELALLSLPSGTAKATIESVAFNPLEIDSYKTVEVVMSYTFFGQVIKASSLFAIRESAAVRFRIEDSPTANSARGATLITFRTAARPGEFDRIRQIFHSSLHSLAGL